MVKYFCNMCGEKLKKRDHWRLKRKIGEFEVEVMHAIKRTWNMGELCHKCIVRIITKGEPVK